MKMRDRLLVGLGTVVLAGCVYSVHAGVATQSKSAGNIVATASMSVARFDHTATLLSNDKVLIVGGLARNGVAQPTAELFDPATGRFTATGKLKSPRGWGATAVGLVNGKVLVVGGSNGSCVFCYLATAELYDPAKGTFSATGSMSVARVGARAALLANGDVLIVGGTETVAADAATAEIYHLASGTFSDAGRMHIPDPSQVVVLKDNHVLVIGASGAELYDPATDRFTVTGKMSVPRTKFGAALLPDGRVLIIGGQVGGAWGTRVASTQVYNPASRTFSEGPELNLKRFKLATSVVALRDGTLLVAGGADQPEIYDPESGKFHLAGGAKLDGFLFSTATGLANGEVLLAGGYATPGGAGVNHAWLYRQ
jgi:hypothetical protein